MNQKILSLSAALAVFACSAHAQMAHYVIGSPHQHEVAKVVKIVPDGTEDCIVAGYAYDLVGGTVTNADMVLMRVQKNGTIAWQTKWGTSDNDIPNDMIITSNQQDGEIVVVGTVGRGTPYVNNTAGIYRFDIATGNMVHQNYVRNNIPGNGAGELFSGVAELQDGSGNLVAVGGHNFTPALVDCMISVFQPDLTNLYNIFMPFSTVQSDHLNSVVAENDHVYITGVVYTGAPPTTHYDQFVTKFTPGITAAAATFNWLNLYDWTYAITGASGNPVTLETQWPNKIYKVGNQLLISGHITESWGAGDGFRHYIFRCDDQGNASTVNMVENGFPGQPYPNQTAMVPVTDDEVFITDVPGSVFYDNEQTGIVAGMNVWASHISSLNGSTVAATFQYALTGNESVQSIDLANNLYITGNIDPQTNDNDIYLAILNTTLLDPDADCPADAFNDLADEPISVQIPTTVINSFVNNGDVAPRFIDPGYNSNIVCGVPIPKFGNELNIKSNGNKTGITVSPNPATDHIVFEYNMPNSATMTLSITNMVGQIMMQHELKGTQGQLQLDTHDLPAGVYLYHITDNNKTVHVGRIVIAD